MVAYNDIIGACFIPPKTSPRLLLFDSKIVIYTTIKNAQVVKLAHFLGLTCKQYKKRKF